MDSNSLDAVRRFLNQKQQKNEDQDINFSVKQRRLLQPHENQDFQFQQQPDQTSTYQGAIFNSPPETPTYYPPANCDVASVSSVSSVSSDFDPNTYIRENLRMLEQLKKNSGSSSSNEKDRAEDVAEAIVDIDKEMFIDIIREYPILWMASHPGYKDLTKKRIKWQHIHEHHLNKKYSGKYILLYTLYCLFAQHHMIIYLENIIA